MAQSQPGALTIRDYRPDDHAVVVRLFREGMESLPINLVHQLLRHRATRAGAAAATALACAPFLHSPARLLCALAACLALMALALAALYLWVLRVAIARYVRGSIKSDLSDIAGTYDTSRGGRFWVAEAADGPAGAPSVVGCVGLEPKSAAVAELRRMVVSLACQRRGVARRLAQELIAHARAAGFEDVVLTTTSLQPAARALYAGLGWREAAGRKSMLLDMITFHEYHLALKQ